MADFRNARILVTGASGKLGTRVLDALAALRAGPMNVVSDAVERLPGRKPRALRHGFEANRSALTG